MTHDASPAVQDFYPDDVAHCYGCGRLNPEGLHIRTAWDGREGTASLLPRAQHVALPGFVYGGLVASLIDCHAIGTAAAAAMVAAGERPGVDTSPRFVTGRLEVDFLRPTPASVELVCRARPVQVGERKVIVEASVMAGDAECARGRVVAVRMPESMRPAGHQHAHA